MKKITMLFACIALFATKSFAQLPESFESATFPPTGWASFVGANGAGAAQNWQQVDFDANTGTYSAYVRWDNTDAGTPKEDWLVTPQITVTAAAPNLLFYHRQQFTFDYGNIYAVKISTTSQTDHAAFTDALVMEEAVVPMTFGAEMLDLSDYIGQQIYIAFVMTNDDGDNWYIDDVNMVGTIVAPECASGPTPADGAIDVEVGTTSFAWTPSATGGDAETYDIYAGLEPDALELLGTIAATEVDILLYDFNTTIYWQVIPRNAAGAATGCEVWSFTTQSPPGYCLNAPNGQYPGGTDGYTPEICDGVTVNEITDLAYTGEYSVVNVESGQTYTFLSGSSDFVTVAALDENTSYAAGDSPFTWVSTLTGQVRFFSHNNDQCEYESELRVRGVICGVASEDAPDYAGLQYPAAATIDQGQTVTVFGQVYEGGLTDVEPGFTGQAEGIQMWVGVSSDNTDPATWGPDSWILADWNEFADPSNNDEYMAEIGNGLTPGTYYYATRFRLNEGVYVYGGTDGTNGNFWDGTTYNNGVLTVNPPPAPENDECSAAIVLTPAGDFAGGAITTTNLGATSTDGIVPSCQDTVGENVWYSVVVPDSGSITIETGAADGSAYNDSVVSVFSGTCGSLTELDCSDDDGEGLFSLITLSGRTPGEVLYVSVWRYNFEFALGEPGQFQISAYDASLSTPVFGGGSFSYYPNPVKNVLNLSVAGEISSVAVYNVIGQRVIATQIGASIGSVDMSALPKGAYLVKVTSGNAGKTIKVIKE